MNKLSVRKIAYYILVVVGVFSFSVGTAKTTLPVQAGIDTGVVLYAAPGGLTGGTCNSWAAACELQTALGLAAVGDEVWVKQGVHKPTSSADPSVTFQLKTGVALYGGFYGTETVREQRDWETNPTVLSGDIDGNDITDPTGVVTSTVNIVGTNSYHVINGSGVDNSAVLDGFTITAGHANGGGESSYGAGLYEVGGSPTLTNMKFIGNLAASYGGGMYNYSGSPVMTNIYFSANSGDGGGGIYHYEGSLTITNAIFSDNEGGFSAGGLGISGPGESRIMNAVFTSNTATYGGGMGAGYSSPVLTNVTFYANSASYGGGLHCDGCNAQLINVLFSGNQAAYGGGMETMNASAPTLTNVTFSGNSAAEGGGLWNHSSSPPLVQNSILWGNAASSAGAQIHNSNNIPTIRYSLVDGCNPGGVWNAACGVDGGGNLPDIDPLFVAPEPASSAPTTAGDYRLQDISPVINMGDNLADLDGAGPGAMTINDIPTDPDGNFRIVRGTVDLGAYENQYIPCPAGGVLYVDKDAAGAQTGETWADAYASLQDALNVSGACELWVAEGVYYPDDGRYVTQNDRAAAFQLKNNVGIFGGFAGMETAREQRDWETHVTVLSGDIDNNDITDPTGVVTSTLNIQGNNSYHVVLGSSVNNSGTLDGFYITAGKANGPFVLPCGGPMCGGGMYVEAGSPTLVNLTFSGNLATYGGGMLNWNSSPNLTNVTFYANQASFGGGMRNVNSHPHLTEVTFSSNKASQGGGMQNQDWSKPALINVAFMGNRATKGGGMWNLNSSKPTLTNVRFSGNLATYGGGIYNEDGSSPILTNVTLSGNQASLGGGIYNDYDSANSSKIQNSIIWSNSAPQIYNEYSFPVIRYSLVEGCNPGGVWESDCGTNGGNNLPDADPLFVAPEPAASAPTIAGDYRLQDASPAINVGDNLADLDGTGPGTLTISDIHTDLDGALRFVGGLVDLGAYENQAFPCPAGGVLYVDQDAAGAQTGESWTDALVTLQDALHVGGACEIWVAEGVYYPDEGGSQADNDCVATYQLKSGVALYGGFAGTETGRDQRDWATNVTVLSGDIDGNDINTDGNFIAETWSDLVGSNSYHVVTGSGVDSSAGLDGFFITAGDALDGGGGGMYNSNGSPMLVNITFSGNLAREGAGMHNAYSNPTLTNVIFSSNQASYNSGGIYNLSSNPKLTNVIFVGNTADSFGGGMANWVNSTPLLTNVIFSANQAGINGGGMWNLSSYPILTNVTFSGNTATNSGGGICNVSGSNPSLQNSILWGNKASMGLQIYSDPGSNPAIDYSLVDGCKPGGVWNTACGIDGGHNLPDADPRFVNAAGGDLRLTRTSPAIDAGDNAALPPDVLDLDGDGNTSEPLPYDLAGNPRQVDVPDTPDTGSGTPPIVDLGAYERGLNRAPAAAAEGYTTDEDTPLAVPAPGLLANDSDPDGDPLSAVQNSGTAHGLLALNLDGSFTYIPALNYHGPDSFTYVASDGGLSSNIVTVNLILNPVNDLPVISEGASVPVSMDEDGAPVPFSLTLHAVDVDGDVLTWSISIPAGHGTASAGGTGASKAIGYTPAANYNGPDSFEVQVSDGNGGVDTILVNVAIAAVNDAPLLDKPADRTINEDAAQQTMNLTGIGDGDPELAQSLDVTAVSSAPGIVPNPTVTYTSPNDMWTLKFTPVTNTNGDATITVTVTDNGSNAPPNVNTVSKQFIVHVISVNDPPAGTSKTVTALEDTSYTLAFSDFGFSDPNDSPPNGFSRVKVTTLPALGSLKLNGVVLTAGQFVSTDDIKAGKLAFSPPADANGVGYASFTFQVEDDGGTANGGAELDPTPNTLTFNVTPLNDAPAGADKTLTTLEDVVYTFTTADFGFSDPYDSPPSSFSRFMVTTLPGSGTLTLNLVAVLPGQFITVDDINAGRLVFSPVDNANGAPYTSFTFQVEDDGGTLNGGMDLDPTPNTLIFDVTPMNDAPQAQGDAYTVGVNSSLAVPAPGVLGNDTDIDSPTLSAILDSGPAHGVLTLNPDGSFLYTPAPGFFGADSFTYHASDGSLSSNIVTVDITVQQVHKIYLPVVLQST